MKVEFNMNSFSSGVNRDGFAGETLGTEFEKGFIKSKMPLIFGAIALFTSVINLPFGMFINLSTEFLQRVHSNGVPHWLSVMLVFSALIIALSIASAVICTVLFAKSKKATTDIAGLIMSILSFVTSAICITLNILGITLW